MATTLAAVARRLSEAGIEGARREAETLVSAASGRARESLLLHPEAQLSEDEMDRLGVLAERRAAREPLPYILGQVEFYSLPFRVTSSVIVPRPETEILAEAAVDRTRSQRARLAIEVGTGCGALAVVLARHVPGLRVVATDISFEALTVAQSNCLHHRVGNQVSWLCADLLAGVRGPADCIVANLPYVPSEDFADLQPEIRDYEPRIALDGGRDGLELVRGLSKQLLDHLSPGGFAALEVGAGQAAEAAKLLVNGGLCEIEVLPDYAGIDRVVIGRRRG